MLADLQAAIAHGAWPAALVEALRLWRAHRFPQLAELVRVVGARIDRAAPRVGRSKHRWWAEVARGQDPADVTMLVDRVRDNILAAASAHVTREAHPRYLDLVQSLGNAWRGPAYLERLLFVLEWPDDPRWIPALDHLRWPQHPTCHAAIDERRAALAHAIEPPAALVDALAELIADATPRSSRDVDDEARLWAAVAAAPRDLGPRQVLADYLISHGDKRGELIALQLAGRETKAERLIQVWRKAWLGELDGFVLRNGSVWRDGFLVEARVGSVNCTAWDPTHRELACLHTLVAAQLSPTRYVELLAALPQVTRIGIYQPEVLAAMAAVRATWPYRVVELGSRDAVNNADGWTVATVDALAAICPDLEVLVVLPRNRRAGYRDSDQSAPIARAREVFPKLRQLWAPRAEVELAGMVDFYDGALPTILP